jgi:hypothetical protein
MINIIGIRKNIICTRNIVLGIRKIVIDIQKKNIIPIIIIIIITITGIPNSEFRKSSLRRNQFSTNFTILGEICRLLLLSISFERIQFQQESRDRIRTFASKF